MIKLKYLKINLNILSMFIAGILATSYTYYYLLVQKTSLGMPDGLSRLNIARRLIDNITPGFAQLGGVWLPIPQILYVPFVQIDYLYRTGLAGSIVNGVLFVLGSYFVFKIVEIATKDRRAAFISTLAYSTSSNLLFFQSSAMSEMAIISFMLGACYYLLKWAIDYKTPDLIISSIFLTLVSLTRYEGFAVLGLSYLSVLIISFAKKRKWATTEGTFITFSTLATFGFFLWTLYLTMIFGDPLYWLHVYTHSISIVSFETLDSVSGNTSPHASFSISLLLNRLITAFNTLFIASIDMNGLLLNILGIIGFIIAIVFFIKQKKIWGLSYLILFGPFIFLIANLLGKNVPLVPPPFSLSSIFDKGFDLESEFNVRYALQLLPIFVVFLGFLARSMKMFSLLLIPLLLFQFIAPFQNVHLLFAIQNRPPEIYSKYGPSIDWMNQHYDHGKILVSVLANDAVIFHINTPYKTFIFEGNNKYFVESVNDPTKYSTWVMFKNIPKDKEIGSFTDRVGFYLEDNPVLLNNYDLVYKGDLLIYKIKTKPREELP